MTTLYDNNNNDNYVLYNYDPRFIFQYWMERVNIMDNLSLPVCYNLEYIEVTTFNFIIGNKCAAKVTLSVRWLAGS